MSQKDLKYSVHVIHMSQKVYTLIVSEFKYWHISSYNRNIHLINDCEIMF